MMYIMKYHCLIKKNVLLYPAPQGSGFYGQLDKNGKNDNLFSQPDQGAGMWS